MEKMNKMLLPVAQLAAPAIRSLPLVVLPVEPVIKSLPPAALPVAPATRNNLFLRPCGH